jgi:adenine phosphoribosyltransferase
VSGSLEARIRGKIRDVPDFPKPGIVFKDITPALADPQLFSQIGAAMADPFREKGVTHVVAIESRGFILGALVSQSLGAAFVPARKKGKLPWITRRVEYALEYGTDTLEIHDDAFASMAKVLVVDDVLATGGTAAATCTLVEQMGASVAGCVFLLELSFLGGVQRLAKHQMVSLVAY